MRGVHLGACPHALGVQLLRYRIVTQTRPSGNEHAPDWVAPSSEGPPPVAGSPFRLAGSGATSPSMYPREAVVRSTEATYGERLMTTSPMQCEGRPGGPRQFTPPLARLVSDRRRSIADVLADARAKLSPRPTPAELASRLAGTVLVVDIRPLEQRTAQGEFPGAIVIGRNVLEWRLDPQSPDRIPEASYDRPIVVVCHEGFSSSLAAATLVELGLDATDLDGGVTAWIIGGHRMISSSTTDAMRVSVAGPEGIRDVLPGVAAGPRAQSNGRLRG